MTNSFLGAGWDFFKLTAPLSEPADSAGASDVRDNEFLRAKEDESIRQAIWIILGTAPGERVMRPDFGCRIHELVFAVPTQATLGQIAAEVRQALTLWEPRIDILDVRAATLAGEPWTIQIEISYQERRTNNLFNLVYPFYLDRSAA